jgi:hypothetical protein
MKNYLKGSWPAGSMNGAHPPFLTGLDPQIAAGEHHVLVFGGGYLGLFDKTGAPVNFQNGSPYVDLSSFHAAAGATFSAAEAVQPNTVPTDESTPASPSYCAFGPGDTRLLYDSYRSRYVVLSAFNSGNMPLWRQKNGPATWYPFLIVVAVSDTADPTGTWHSHKFNATPAPNGNFNPHHAADFPSHGVDSSCFFFTINVFDQSGFKDDVFGVFQYGNVTVLDATAMAQNKPLKPAVFQEKNAFSLWPPISIGDGLHGAHNSATLATTQGPTGPKVQLHWSSAANNVAFFACWKDSSMKLFRLVYDPNNISSISGFTKSDSIALSGGAGTPGAKAGQKSDIPGKTAPQIGMAYGAVLGTQFRGGKLYLTSGDTIKPPSGVKLAGRITCISFHKTAENVTQFNNDQSYAPDTKPVIDRVFGVASADDPPGNEFDYGFPAVGVNKDGVMGIVTIRSSANSFVEIRAGAYDPKDGDISSSIQLAAGTATLWDPNGRMGDLFGASVDPADDTAVWVVGHCPIKTPDKQQSLWFGKLF